MSNSTEPRSYVLTSKDITIQEGGEHFCGNCFKVINVGEEVWYRFTEDHFDYCSNACLLKHEKMLAPDTVLLAEDSSKCPKCGSSDLDGEPWDCDNKAAWQEVSCLECDAKWTDVYNMNHRLIPAEDK